MESLQNHVRDYSNGLRQGEPRTGTAVDRQTPLGLTAASYRRLTVRA